MTERATIPKQRVIRTLLNNPDNQMTIYRLAQLALCKYPSVHRILNQLKTKHLIQGTRVKDYKALVNLWRKWQVEPNKRDYFMKVPLDILRNTRLSYALTTYQAENMFQSYLFPSLTEFHILPNDKKKWHDLLSSEGLVGHGNTRILFGDEHALYNSIEIKGIKIVSIPQLIIDL